MAQNRQLKPAQVLDLGIVGRDVRPGRLLRGVAALGGAGPHRDVNVQRRRIDRGAAWDETVAAVRRTRRQAEGRHAGPYRALDLIALAKTATARRGLRQLRTRRWPT